MTDNPQTIIALAYFDLALYEPTRKCLEAIRPHLVRGSILAMDELNSRDFPGETVEVSVDECRIDAVLGRRIILFERFKISRSRQMRYRQQ